MSAGERDAAARYLDLVVRLLPAARRQWGRAMRAELAAIDRPAARRRFALGCTRVILLPARTRQASVVLAAAGVAGASTAFDPAIPAVLILALLAWLGRRPGHLGPVRPDRAARSVRAAGWTLMSACLVFQIAGAGLRGGLFPTLLLTLPAAMFLALTAQGTRASDVALAAGAAAGFVTGLAGFLVMPFERIGTPLAAGLPGHGRWLVVVVFAAPVAAALLTGSRTLQRDQAIIAVACAGTFAALTVAVMGLAAIVLFPHSVPDIVGSVMMPGTSASARQAADAAEAADPYWGFLAFGAMLATLLWAVARPPSQADVKVVLLALLAAPPIALAVSAGAGTIAFATAAVVLAAAVTTHRGAAAAS